MAKADNEDNLNAQSPGDIIRKIEALDLENIDSPIFFNLDELSTSFKTSLRDQFNEASGAIVARDYKKHIDAFAKAHSQEIDLKGANVFEHLAATYPHILKFNDIYEHLKQNEDALQDIEGAFSSQGIDVDDPNIYGLALFCLMKDMHDSGFLPWKTPENISEKYINGLARNTTIMPQLVQIKPTPAFTQWNDQKQTEVMGALQNDPDFMTGLAEVKRAHELETAEDFKNQYDLRDALTSEVAQAYAQVYGFELSENEARVKMVQSFDDNIAIGLKIKGVVSYDIGQEGESVMSVLYDPLYEVREGLDNNAEALNDFLLTVMEEATHLRDLHIADKILTGELTPDDPAFSHGLIITLNSWVYDNNDFYAEQYIERTAKADAALMVETLKKDVYPSPAPEPSPNSTQTSQRESADPQPPVTPAPPIPGV